MNSSGVWIHGSPDDVSSNNFTSNFVDGKPIYYYINETGLESKNFTNAGQIILVNCNNTVIENLDLSHSTVGILLYACKNNTVSGNTLNNNTFCGIYLVLSYNNTISGNFVNNSGLLFGISISYSGNNTIRNNSAYNNDVGIFMVECENNNVSGNIINNNRIHGIYLNGCNNSRFSRNTVNNNSKSGFYISNCHSNTFTNNTANNNNEYGIYLGSRPVFGWGIIGGCVNNKIRNTSVNSNGINGIYLISSNYTTISGNIVNNNTNYGIYLFDKCNNNNITENTVQNNNQIGIVIEGNCDNNLIYLNNFSRNEENARDDGNSNYWDNINIGNYWWDYTDIDTNDDGIGDTAYNIPGTAGSQDNFPIWWDAPVLYIAEPTMGQKFGSIAPACNISIVEGLGEYFWCEFLEIEKIINLTKLNGVANDNITGLIDQDQWKTLSNGNITIRFYCNDSRGYIVYIDVNVIKSVITDGGGDGNGDDSSKSDVFDTTIVMVIGLIVIAVAAFLVIGRTYVSRKGGIRKDTSNIKEYIKQREEIVEDDIILSKEKHFCLVHKGPIEGYNFICPTCGAYYCIRCVEAIKELENACWSCGKPLDPSLPTKTLEEEYDIKPIKDNDFK